MSLQSNDNDERLQVVKLLAKMFGAKDSELAAQNKPLWQCYLGRWVSELCQWQLQIHGKVLKYLYCDTFRDTCRVFKQLLFLISLAP